MLTKINFFPEKKRKGAKCILALFLAKRCANKIKRKMPIFW
jgi:hypothetical protein